MKIFIISMDYHSYGLLASLLINCVLFFLLRRKHTQHHATTPTHQSSPSNSSSDPALEELLETEEEQLIQNIKDFQDTIVREVMIPRIDIVAVDETTTLKEFRALALDKGHSRIPVYHDTVDQIVGIAYVKDMLRYWESDENIITVTALMRPPYFVPETKNIGPLLNEFQVQKVHIAVAIDEYGGTAGIVTIEDLVEEVFGEIEDEHDEEEEELIKAVDEHTFLVNAKASIDELEDVVGELTIEQQDFDSVGGLLFSVLGEIPKEKETMEFQHLKFTILQADRHRILEVKVERLPAHIAR